MEILKENQFIKIYFDKEQELIIDEWLPETRHMTADDFKANLRLWLGLVKQHHPKKSMIDVRKIQFMIEPELQEWASQHVLMPAFQAGLQKIATVLPPSLFEQVSIQQALEEPKAVAQRRFFDDEAEAKQWLFSQ
ncbi:STAS/SEC14 domain-containing protein [Microscilla marina]|uniref:STAS/SEC14 domain-containing protein n=1 Tax=Microscilla marina ATCC 23134 TaxID=313606 RepID=A1ZG16_MICM2|nr:STAS/SEC14 domain-containing protein [Microscilla marina]EAY30433.1 hypothetical protein M23134_03069 [Microscilla marina ATCC 23134]